MSLAGILVLMLSSTTERFSFASGQMPCKSFVSADGRSFSIADAYGAADLVVIGQVSYGKVPSLKISRRIKGYEKANEIKLTASHCQGTACSGGFSVASKVDLLFLLKRLPDDVYDSVTGNGNYSCPVVYEVENNSVKFLNKSVPLVSLEKYFQSRPNPIPLY